MYQDAGCRLTPGPCCLNAREGVRETPLNEVTQDAYDAGLELPEEPHPCHSGETVILTWPAREEQCLPPTEVQGKVSRAEGTARRGP